MARHFLNRLGGSLAAIFGASIVAMLTASAFYHCHADTAATKLRARRLDHADPLRRDGHVDDATVLGILPALSLNRIKYIYMV